MVIRNPTANSPQLAALSALLRPTSLFFSKCPLFVGCTPVIAISIPAAFIRKISLPCHII